MTEKRKINNIIDRSEKTQEILTYSPHWLVRYGITIIALFILVLIILSRYINYTDGKTVFDMIFEKIF
ncbi:MAG: hypothetical protein PF638_07375 [Candidatus Delongbacteria bacterium]|jgi:hypothetical protein|nr:hypothetical protein [Candidatus Delongbacteria bacterium]